MDEKTIKLIEQLAKKLGTTSEYLWLVLLKQAPLEAAITLLKGVFIIIFGIALFKLHKYFSKNREDRNGYGSIYYDSEELVKIPMVIGLAAFVCVSIAWLCCIGDIFNGFLNPEYWALQNILSNLK